MRIRPASNDPRSARDRDTDDGRRQGPPYGADFSQSGGGYASHHHQGYPDGRGSHRLGRPEGDWARPHPWSPWPPRARPPSQASGERSWRGFGPRNVSRSDASLKDEIVERLTADPWLDARDIALECSNGVVTLTGLVQRRDDRYRAEDLAAAVYGVSDVANRLTVRRR